MSRTATATANYPASHTSIAADAIELARVASPGSRAGRAVGPGPPDSKRDSASATEAALGGVSDDGAPPPDAHGPVERWNRPRANIGKLGFAFVSFIIAGMNDGAVGVSARSSLAKNYKN